MPSKLVMFLILIGGMIAVTGITLAVLEVGAMYTQAVNDPLGEPQHEEKTEVPHRIFMRLGIAAAGMIPFVVGTTMWKIELVKRAIRVQKRVEAQAVGGPIATESQLPYDFSDAGVHRAERDRHDQFEGL